MYLNPSKTLHSFLILFFLKEIDATLSPDPYLKYDITKIINDTVVKLLSSTDLDAIIKSWMRPVDGSYFSHEISIKNTFKIPPFEDIIFLHGRFIHPYFGFPYFSEENKAKIRWDSSKTEMSISYDEIGFHVYGRVDSKPENIYLDRKYYYFQVYAVIFDNFTIISTKLSPTQHTDQKVLINVSYDGAKNLRGVKLTDARGIPHSYKQQMRLVYVIASEYPAIISDFITKNNHFHDFCDSILVTIKERIASIHPDFPDNELNYYYSIPDILVVYANFKNIKIMGLWNSEPHIRNNVISLLVKNVRGNMTLDTGFEHFPQFELKFTIGELSMSIDQETKRIRVMARNYTIVEKAPKPQILISSWLKEFSTFIMELIESAIEVSTMPSMGYRPCLSPSNISEMDTSLIQLLKKSIDV